MKTFNLKDIALDFRTVKGEAFTYPTLKTLTENGLYFNNKNEKVIIRNKKVHSENCSAARLGLSLYNNVSYYLIGGFCVFLRSENNENL